MFLLSSLQFVGVLGKFVLTAERKLDIMTLVRVLYMFSFGCHTGRFRFAPISKHLITVLSEKIQRSRYGGFAVIIIRQNFNGFNRFRQNFYTLFDCTKEGAVFYAHCRRTK
nr:MAG TPA: hypothetical protein [Bacteriophage sp.]